RRVPVDCERVGGARLGRGQGGLDVRHPSRRAPRRAGRAGGGGLRCPASVMSELPGRTEVLVVGAGPVGLAVAASLAGHGHDVAVVERQATGANTSRAAVVHARTLEMLERIGVSKRLAGLGIHASQFSIRDGDRELVPVRFDRLQTRYPYTLMVPQNITEQVLLERLEELGGRVHRPCVATGIRQNADRAEVTLDNGDVIEAQYVV